MRIQIGTDLVYKTVGFGFILFTSVNLYFLSFFKYTSWCFLVIYSKNFKKNKNIKFLFLFLK